MSQDISFVNGFSNDALWITRQSYFIFGAIQVLDYGVELSKAAKGFEENGNEW